MTPINTSTDALLYLTQPGGPLGSLPTTIPASTLESASPQDLVSLSAAAMQTQVVDELYGIPPAGGTALPGLPAPALSTDALATVDTASLAGATPQQQAELGDQSLLLEQVQGLYSAPGVTTGTLNAAG